MADTIDYLAKFGEYFGAFKGSKGTVENLGSNDIRRKISGRNTIKKKEKIAPHISVPDAVIEKLAVGYEGIAHDQLYGFFGENREAVLKSLPDKTLESKFLDIDPVKVEDNDRHNEIALMHASYMGVQKLNKNFDEGKDRGKYMIQLSETAAQQTAHELSQKEYLQKSTVILMAEARAELVASSEILARTMGSQLEAQAKKAVIGRIEEMENAKKPNERYTRVEYARNNLIHNGDDDYVIDMAGKCLPQK